MMRCTSSIRRYASPSVPLADPMQPKRRTITLDLPREQIAWLDKQAGAVMSRSAYIRQLIANAMQEMAKR